MSNSIYTYYVFNYLIFYQSYISLYVKVSDTQAWNSISFNQPSLWFGFLQNGHFIVTKSTVFLESITRALVLQVYR